MKILLIANSAWSLYKFRRGLIEALICQHHQVLLVAPEDEYADQLVRLGASYHPLPYLEGKGKNPVKEILLVSHLRKLYQVLKPDLIFQYTIKPNIYSSIVARLLNIPCVGVVTGLGYTFINHGITSFIAKKLYQFAFRYTDEVWFLNEDDRLLFVNSGLVKSFKTFLINGEGIDCEEFNPCRYKEKLEARFKSDSFIFVARMLYDKGVREFVEAAKEIRQEFPQVKFSLLGYLNVDNPSAVSESEMNDWVSSGVVEYLGSVDDVREAILNHSCVVLPSYREGMSMVLLESAALATPIITTNIPGCKELVEDGITGYLCEPRDSASLVVQIRKFIELSEKDRMEMGVKGRQKMVAEFSDKQIIEVYLKKLEGFQKQWF